LSAAAFRKNASEVGTDFSQELDDGRRELEKAGDDQLLKQVAHDHKYADAGSTVPSGAGITPTTEDCAGRCDLARPSFPMAAPTAPA
jgi:hypothetical protein